MNTLTNPEVLARLATGLHLARPLVFLDLETTGLSVERDRIVQLALLRLEVDGHVASGFDGLVNPEMPIPPEATAIHGITDAMVKDAPTFQRIAGDVFALVFGADLCGYNARKFDVPLLGAEFARIAHPRAAEFKLGAHIVDPFLLWQRQCPRTLGGAMAEFCGVPDFEGHAAMDDVCATIAVLDAQLQRWPDVPADVERLATFCENRDASWIDADGKLAWRNGEACLNFGQQAGVPLRKADRGFLTWMLKKDFSEDVKTIVLKALRGTYPTAPTKGAA